MRHPIAPVMPATPNLPSQSKAIAAFLRGVERRARLLAETQCGSPEPARRALVVAAQVFSSEAGQWPIAQWPMQYWRLLLSVPVMGHAAADTDAGPLPGIAALPAATRAAVLLHLVASLEEVDAAAALNLDIAGYQQRIRDALPRDAQGQPDLATWRQWRDAVPPALAQPVPAPAATPPPHAVASPPRLPSRHLLRWLWLGVAVGLAALAATFFLHPRGRVLWNEWHTRVRVEALPAAAAPKARFDPADPRFDPDRALLAAPAELALARELPLLAWLSTQTEPLPAADPVSMSPAVPTPPLPAAPLARARLRGAWAEWQALPETERSVLRQTAAHFNALPASTRQALREHYAQQSYDAHRGWHLGPQLGRDWPRIAPLFTFVDASERDALLQLLRAASSEDIDTLARLAQITPPEARAALRQALLAVPAAQRSAWLQAQLNR